MEQLEHYIISIYNEICTGNLIRRMQEGMLIMHITVGIKAKIRFVFSRK